MELKHKIFVLARPAFLKADNNLGGVIVSSRYLLRYLDYFHKNYEVVDTYSRNYKAIKSVYIIIKSFFCILRCKIIFLNLNEREIIFYGPLLVILAKLFRRKLYVRFFGGNLDLLIKKSKIYLISTKIIYFFSDRVLLQTKYLCDFFENEKNYFFPTSRDSFHYVSESKKNSPKRLVYAGQISLKKGIKMILDVAGEFENEINFHLYGNLVDIKQADLVKPNVIYEGSLDNTELHKSLSNFDYFCFPSKHEGEGYPGAIIEAFMAQVPVLATRWRAIPEIVVDRETGYLFEPDNLEEFRRVLKKAIKTNKEYFEKRIKIKAIEFNAKHRYADLFQLFQRDY